MISPARIEDHVGRQANLTTSRQPYDCWHNGIGDDTFSDTMLDQLVCHFHRLTVSGGSSRNLRSPESPTHNRQTSASLPGRPASAE